jgi:hypothetical protein
MHFSSGSPTFFHPINICQGKNYSIYSRRNPNYSIIIPLSKTSLLLYFMKAVLQHKNLSRLFANIIPEIPDFQARKGPVSRT